MIEAAFQQFSFLIQVSIHQYSINCFAFHIMLTDRIFSSLSFFFLFVKSIQGLALLICFVLKAEMKLKTDVLNKSNSKQIIEDYCSGSINSPLNCKQKSSYYYLLCIFDNEFQLKTITFYFIKIEFTIHGVVLRSEIKQKKRFYLHLSICYLS